MQTRKLIKCIDDAVGFFHTEGTISKSQTVIHKGLKQEKAFELYFMKEKKSIVAIFIKDIQKTDLE